MSTLIVCDFCKGTERVTKIINILPRPDRFAQRISGGTVYTNLNDKSMGGYDICEDCANEIYLRIKK